MKILFPMASVQSIIYLETKLANMETQIEHNKVWLYKDEYEDMLEYIAYFAVI